MREGHVLADYRRPALRSQISLWSRHWSAVPATNEARRHLLPAGRQYRGNKIHASEHDKSADVDF